MDDFEDTPSFVAETAAAELLDYNIQVFAFAYHVTALIRKKKLNGMKRSTYIYLDSLTK